MKQFCAVVGMLWATLSSADVVNKAEFSFELPADWVEIPATAISEYQAVLTKKVHGYAFPDCTYAFQIKNTNWFAEPFMTVLVDNSSTISEAEFKQASTKQMQSSIEKKLGPYNEELKATAGQPIYDAEKRILWTIVSLEAGGTAYAPIAAFLTSRGLIGFSATCRDDDALAQFSTIMNSVTLTSDYQYRGSILDASPLLSKFNWTKISAGLVFVVLFYLMARPKQKRPEGTSEAEPPQVDKF